MDDPGDRGYSRAPELDDLLRVCESLNRHRASYILIGGFAVILHGFVRGTKDIDLLIDSSYENVVRVKQALSILADNAVSLVSDDDIRRYTVVRVADEIVIDLLERACGIDFATAKDEIDVFTIRGVEIPVAGKELLIRMKDTVRPSDHTDVAYLRMLLDGE
jgi:hypothetical protein